MIQNVKKPESKLWIIYSLLSALAYGLAGFSIYSIDKIEGSFNVVSLMVVYFSFISVMGIIIYILKKKDIIKNKIFDNYDKDIDTMLKNKKYLSLLVFTTFLLVISTMCLYGAYNTAPNPGICDVISSFSNILLMVLLYIFFKTKIHLINGVGVVLMVISGYFILS